jgi:hypothetical protein
MESDMSASNYNQGHQGQQNPRGHQPAQHGDGQKPSPKPGEQDNLPDQSNVQNEVGQGAGQHENRPPRKSTSAS